MVLPCSFHKVMRYTASGPHLLVTGTSHIHPVNFTLETFEVIIFLSFLFYNCAGYLYMQFFYVIGF